MIRKFVINRSSQRILDFFLLAQSNVVKESFQDILGEFGPVREEISDIEENVIIVNAQNINDVFLLVSTFKVLYEITCAFSASSTYLCPFFGTLKSRMDIKKT